MPMSALAAISLHPAARELHTRFELQDEREAVARVLNASIVGLLRAPVVNGARHLPAVTEATGWAAYECVGLAMVRHVDAASGYLFLSTPVAAPLLTDVCVLARVSMEVPLALLHPTALTQASPYLAFDVLKTPGAGAQRMRSRNNLVRGPVT